MDVLLLLEPDTVAFRRNVHFIVLAVLMGCHNSSAGLREPQPARVGAFFTAVTSGHIRGALMADVASELILPELSIIIYTRAS